MSIETVFRVITLILTLSVAPVFAQVCYPPVAGPESELIYEDGFNGNWREHGWPQGVVTWNPYAKPPGHNGQYAAAVNFGSIWNEFVLYRNGYFYPATKRALVFRIRGIGDNWMQQVWLELRDLSYVPFATVEITDYMVSPPLHGWQYDPNQWYTVVIPMWAFFGTAPMSISPGTIARDLVIRAGNSPLIYLDDMWWVGGLEFPLREGEDPINPTWRRAGYPDVSSVFDHSQPGTAPITFPFPTADNTVIAYTGEIGNYSVRAGVCWSQNANLTLFNVEGQYVGANECNNRQYLSYNGHPAIDYRASPGTPMYSPGDGVITLSDCAEKSTGKSCVDRGTGWGKLIINLDGPYTISFNHNSFVADGLGVGSRVSAGQRVGYSGDTVPSNEPPVGPHVHMGVLLDTGVYVDPYGWTGSGPDPYRHRAVNVRLWKAPQ